MFGPYAGFILASYIATFGSIVVLLIWIIRSNQLRRREITRLEEQGVSRRSASQLAKSTGTVDS